jgi:hypothetical protein
MSRRATCIISSLLLLALAGGVSAATVSWDKGGATRLWNVAANWDTDGVPTAADTAQFFLADANGVIDSTVTADCLTLSVGGTVVGTSYLDMTGGTLTVATTDTAAYGIYVGQSAQGAGVFIMSGGVLTDPARLAVGVSGTGTFILRNGTVNIGGDKIELGRNANSVGAIYVEGGSLSLTSWDAVTGLTPDLEIGNYGTGTFQMTGGYVRVADQVKLSQGGITQTTGVSYLNLYGGTLDANGLRNPSEGIYGKPKINITEGTLILRTDHRPVVKEYIKRGWLVAYNGQGLVKTVYTADPNQTTVTGIKLAAEQASNPTPADQTTVSKPVTLSWKPGSKAVKHDVYLGTDFNDVSNASRTSDPHSVLVSKGQDPNTYASTNVALGQTYYWRIDEVDNANPVNTWKGAVFQFTVTAYVLVDDFESYNGIPAEQPGSHLIYYVWTDGYGKEATNGALIGNQYGDPMEKTIVHGGLQSVPVMYNDMTAPSSEVSVKMTDSHIGTNWTSDNLTTLSLWFYGNATNSAEQMYVKLNGIRVDYSGAAADLQQTFWHEWLVPLSKFGIDLKNVADLTIGFARIGAAGGAGTVLFDDIRLTAAVIDASAVQLARWPLIDTTTTTAVSSDKVTASAETNSALYVIRDYQGVNKSQRVYSNSTSTLGNWPNETTQNLDRWAQFAFTPKTGYSVKVTSISLNVGNSGGSTNVRVSLYYSTDGFATSKVLEEGIVLPSSNLVPKTYTPNVQVPSGKTFSLRACPWLQGGQANGKYFNIQDVVMSGTTTP